MRQTLLVVDDQPRHAKFSLIAITMYPPTLQRSFLFNTDAHIIRCRLDASNMASSLY